MKLFETFENEKDFSYALNKYFSEDENILPVLVENRENLKRTIEESNTFYNYFVTPKKVKYGVDLTNIECLKKYKDNLAETWLLEGNIIPSEIKNSTILIFGLYEDFQFKKLKELFLNVQKYDINLCAIIARDLSSLSWLCAKQFVVFNDENFQNGIYSCKKVNLQIKEKWLSNDPNLTIIDKNALRKTNLQEHMLKKKWKSLLLYGHGKEDNLNLDAYTVCGKNIDALKKVGYSPQCGYCNQSCFKDENKLIYANDIIAESITLNSCNNAPFSDMSLYDNKYNLLLNTIDGTAKTIHVAITAQNSEIVELDRIVENNFLNISNIINSSLESFQTQLSMLQIGIEPQEKVRFEESLPKPSIIDSINRAKQYKMSGFLNAEDKIYKLIDNFLLKSSEFIVRNNIISNLEGLNNQWGKKVNILNELIGNEILKDQFNSILTFDDYTISRSFIDKNSIKKVICDCGHESLHFKYVPYFSVDFPIEMLFCYRCGDKAIKMSGTPELRVVAPEHVNVGEKILVNLNAISENNDDIYFGWFVPSYIEEHLLNPPKKIKKINSNSEVNFEIEFDHKIPSQGYYFTVFVIQNLGISFKRHFISIERK